MRFIIEVDGTASESHRSVQDLKTMMPAEVVSLICDQPFPDECQAGNPPKDAVRP